MKHARWITIATIFASGCSLLIDSGRYLGGSNDGGTDGGMGDAGVPTSCADTVVPSGSVIGFSNFRHVSETDEIHVPEDLSAYTIQAYLPEENGFRVLDGVGTADGTFRIDGVPDGATYYLKLVTPAGNVSFRVTDLRCVDLDRYIGGRPDAVTVSLSQPLELHLDNMQPWGPNDELIAEVFNTSTECWDFQFLLEEGLPNRGATTIDATYDWGGPFCYSYRLDGRPALIEAGAGDVLQFAHARVADQLDNNNRLQHAISTLDVVDVPGVTTASGATTVVDASFEPLTLDRMVRFTLNRSLFDGAYADVPSTFESVVQGMYGSPGTGRSINTGIPLASANLVDWSGTAPRTSTVDVAYGDPLPTEWVRVFDQRYTRFRWVRAPGASNSRPLGMGITRQMEFAPPLPDRPPIVPPTNVQIEGVDANGGGRAPFDGSAPVTVSWMGVGSATLYSVTAIRIFRDVNNTANAPGITVFTRETSVDIPAEVFTGGEFFVFRITAFDEGGLYGRGSLLLQAFPSFSASTFTGLMRLDDHCGDGNVQSGEDCDTSGASATCDADCTMPVCGDGFHNAMAGEACDGGGVETSLCNGDCTLPTCGDDILNPEIEDCDDGNTVNDGNGCSNACRANNDCGDGIVEDAVEQCDDGNQTDEGNGCNAACRGNNVCGDGIVESAIEQCDSMGVDTMTCVAERCATSVCGDGYANAAANEECDDVGDTPSCDSDCTVIMCGDNHVNASAGETCDPPNGTTCLANCTTTP